jgi:ribonuclease HI
MKGFVFCDGACSGNGTKKSVGGWAWAFWAGKHLSDIQGEPTRWCISPLAIGPNGEPHTNQRAELTALLSAIQWIATAVALDTTTIYSDSDYSIKCASVWGPGWKRKGWKKSTPGEIQNLDLIQPLVDIYLANKHRIRLEHVRGHQKAVTPTSYGNNWVDRAAVSGAEGMTAENVSTVFESETETETKTVKKLEKPTVKYVTGDIRDYL